MKNLLKTSFVLFFFAALSLGFTSCGGDDCYECLGDDTLEDLGTICVGDDDGAGGEVTSEQLEQAVAAYELFGGTCTKK